MDNEFSEKEAEITNCFDGINTFIEITLLYTHQSIATFLI